VASALMGWFCFCCARIILVQMSPSETFLQLSLETRQLLPGAVEKLLIVGLMTIFSFTILIMEVLGC
jgi:hypothetical protein